MHIEYEIMLITKITTVDRRIERYDVVLVTYSAYILMLDAVGLQRSMSAVLLLEHALSIYDSFYEQIRHRSSRQVVTCGRRYQHLCSYWNHCMLVYSKADIYYIRYNNDDNNIDPNYYRYAVFIRYQVYTCNVYMDSVVPFDTIQNFDDFEGKWNYINNINIVGTR